MISQAESSGTIVELQLVVCNGETIILAANPYVKAFQKGSVA